MSYNLLMFISSYINLYIMFILFPVKLFNENSKLYFNKKHLLISLLVMPIPIWSINLSLLYKSSIVIGLTYLICKYFYDKNNINTIIVALVSYTLGLGCDMINSLLFLLVFKLDIQSITNDPILVFGMHLSLLLISIFIVFLINLKGFFENFNTNINIINKKNIMIYLTTSLIILSTIGYLVFCQPYLSISHTISIILFFSYLIFNMIFIHQISLLVITDNNLEQTKKEYKVLYNYSEDIEKVVGQLRQLNHEHNNELIAIKGLTASNQNEETIKYIDTILNHKFKAFSFSSIDKFSFVKNPAIKAVFVAKAAEMISKNIKLDVEIRKEIDVLNINTNDLCNIIGVFLDNAIESVENLEERIVSITIMKREEGINIIIANTFENKINFNSIFNPGFSTKGNNRGYGLSLVKETIDKYKNVSLDTNASKCFFIQDLCVEDY